MLTAASLPGVEQLRRQHLTELIQKGTASHLQVLLLENPITEEDLSVQVTSPEFTVNSNTLPQATSPAHCESVAGQPDCPTIEAVYPDIDLEDIFQSMDNLAMDMSDGPATSTQDEEQSEQHKAALEPMAVVPVSPAG